MRRIAAPSSPLLPVTKSLAWINAPTIHNIKTHLILARLEYAEAIAKLRKRLQSPASGAVNETLLVILLLSMTEPVLGDPVSVDLATLTHLIGASRFIESSKLCSSFSGFPAPIIAVLMNNMIFGCLSCLAERASLLCSTLQALHKISISTSSLPPGSAYIIRLGVSVVEIHNEVRLRQFSNWVDTSQNQLNILLEKCSATLKEISIWSHLWEPKAHNLSPDEWNQLLTVGSVWNRSEAPKDVSMWFRKDWSQLCLYQLILHVAACRCVQQLSRTIDASPGHAEEELRMLKVTNSKIKTALDNVAQEIKDFVPVFLGTNNRYMADGVLLRIAAYAMLMPLRVAITVPGLGAKFRAELEVAVELIANHAGISRNFITDRVQTTVFE
ncbi:uncharacterized protein LY89DRAFT_784282 [Mollisia scopiformis]|uniref:Uncharacterized protein n=1 Tax=Mollisia scopiformis TaxID=149040 RepID=A0A194X294_MOLSC|nr:uncharacterized protein LY89DRAFT_784282 [Mollisia scopiformis]KUJ14321.1 hypothetical protein LY89DRAFT_784282 [Mollisia scopiformis]